MGGLGGCHASPTVGSVGEQGGGAKPLENLQYLP